MFNYFHPIYFPIWSPQQCSRGTKKKYVFIPWYPISYLTIASYGFFFWALTGPYPTLRFGGACGLVVGAFSWKHTRIHVWLSGSKKTRYHKYARVGTYIPHTNTRMICCCSCIAVDTLSTLGSLFSSIPPYRVARDSGTWGDWQVIEPIFAASPSARQWSGHPQSLGGSGDLSLSLLRHHHCKQTDPHHRVDRSTSSYFIY